MRKRDNKINHLDSQLKYYKQKEYEQRKRQRKQDEEEAERLQIMKRVQIAKEEKWKTKNDQQSSP